MSCKVFKLRKRTITLSTTALAWVFRKIQAIILCGVIYENGVAPALGEGKEDPAKYTRRLSFTRSPLFGLSNLNGFAFVSFLFQFFRNEW